MTEGIGNTLPRSRGAVDSGDIADIPQQLTMSSLEIAGLTGKRHLHILRDVRRMMAELGEGETKFGSTYLDRQGKAHPVYHLPHRETMILVSGYSVRVRAAIVDRWTQLERVIRQDVTAPARVDLDEGAKNAVGGMLKRILAKQLAEIVPSLVAAEIAAHNFALRRGQTAGQIWASLGLPRIKGAAAWFGNRLDAVGCRIDGGGRGELGTRTARLYDPDKVTSWFRTGGRLLVEQKIAERRGQGRLRLVQAG